MASRRILVADDILNEIDRDSFIDDEDIDESSETSFLESSTPVSRKSSSGGPCINALGFSLRPQSSSTGELRANVLYRSNTPTRSSSPRPVSSESPTIAYRSDFLPTRSSTPRPVLPETPTNSSAGNTSLISQSSPDVDTVTLADLYQQNKRLAQELKEVKSRLTNGKRETQKSKRVVVSSACSQAVREVYGKLFRPGDQNEGFNLSLMKSCSENEGIIARLTREVQSLHGRNRWEVVQIKKACKTYYNSLRDKLRRQNNGTYMKHTDAARKRSRKFRKMQRRTSALETITLPENVKAQAKEILSLEYVSSEESMSEEEDGGTQAKTRKLRKLPWERSKLTSLKHKLDAHFAVTAPAVVSRLLPKFIMSGHSSRPAPEGAPSWAVRY